MEGGGGGGVNKHTPGLIRNLLAFRSSPFKISRNSSLSLLGFRGDLNTNIIYGNNQPNNSLVFSVTWFSLTSSCLTTCDTTSPSPVSGPR